MRSKMIDVPLDKIMMLSSCCLLLLITAYNVAGMMSDEVATVMSEDMVDATVELKLCSRYLRPPAKKQHPRTRRMLDKMLPNMLAWTMRISFFCRAIMLTCLY